MKLLYLPHQYSQQRQREKKRWIFPILLAMEAEWYRENGHEVLWAKEGYDYRRIENQGDHLFHVYDKTVREPEGLPFLNLPIADRIFTDAKNKKYQSNGNFKYRPGTYIQAASGCWYGKCSFCVECNKPVITRPVDSVIQELYYLRHLEFKEIFDDSGTFPCGLWLERFARKKAQGLKDLHFSCNMRFGAKVDYGLLKEAGFRMLLYGLESANQTTLDRLKKGIDFDTVESELKEASGEGLEPHIAIICGYPWESAEEELKTLKFVHYLLRKGYAKTAQASLYTVENEKAIDRGMVKRVYDIGYDPRFWVRRIRDIRRPMDLNYLVRQIKHGVNRD